MLGRKLAAVAMSAVLAASMVPSIAMAAPLASGQALETQATKTVYVIDKVTVTNEYAPDSEDDEPYSSKYVHKFTYKNGFVTSRIYDGTKDISYSYSGINLKKVKMGSRVFTYATKAGKVQTATLSNSNEKVVYTSGYNKAGKLVLQRNDYYYKIDGKMQKTSTNLMKYKVNKAGYPVKSTVSYNSMYGSNVKARPYRSFSYDKQGNLKGGAILQTKEKVKMTNAYDKNGCLEKRVVTFNQNANVATYQYHYKKVKVKATWLPTIEAQQWALRNNDLNGAFGGLAPSILSW